MNLILHLPPNWHHRHFSETASTMLLLHDRRWMDRPEEFVLVTADFQTAGRGQRGTHWESAPEANLLFGIMCHPSFLDADKQFLLSEVQALAVARALSDRIDGISVKWPNDVYAGDRKICGMLLEHDLCGTHIATTITGVGLNVNQPHFESDAPNPVSLFQLTGHTVDRAALMIDIIERFEHDYRRLQNGLSAKVHADYRSLLYRGKGLHRFAEPGQKPFYAAIDDVLPDGHMRLLDENGAIRQYAFKEVAFVI